MSKSFSRRSFLTLLALGWLGLQSELRAAPVDRFLKLSSDLTGFPVADLDPDLGAMYQTAVRGLDAATLDALLRGEEPAERDRVERMIVELWYTGVLPTDSGSKVVAFRHSLAWRSLEFCDPPTYCGPAWWR